MRNEDRKKTGRQEERTGQDRAQPVRKWKLHFPSQCSCGLPVFTHSLSVTLHCCSGDSVVVVKGERKTAVPPLGVLALGTGGAKILLLLSVLMAVEVAALLGESVGGAVVVAGGKRVARAETAVVSRDLTSADGVAVESWKEAVVVSCGGGRGDT